MISNILNNWIKYLKKKFIKSIYTKIADLIVRTALKQSKMEKMLLFLNDHERCWISVWNEDWFHLVQQSEIVSIFEILKILVIHAVFLLWVPSHSFKTVKTRVYTMSEYLTTLEFLYANDVQTIVNHDSGWDRRDHPVVMG